MALARVGTGHKGVQSFDLMDKTVFREKIQSAIGNWRLRSESRVSQKIKNGICAKCAVFL